MKVHIKKVDTETGELIWESEELCLISSIGGYATSMAFSDVVEVKPGQQLIITPIAEKV